MPQSLMTNDISDTEYVINMIEWIEKKLKMVGMKPQ